MTTEVAGSPTTQITDRIRDARRRQKIKRAASALDRTRHTAVPVRSLPKQIIDVIGSAVGLVLLCPLLLGIAAAIKLTSRGPVFFRQTRLGLNGRPFSIYKFRTMYTDRCDQSGVTQTVADDPRVTRVGHFLRRTSFDELPQLLNVLKGDMSLVGPRPYVPGMKAGGRRYEDLDHRYYDRLKVLPGITGLAQVKGYRGETANAETARTRLEYDFAYIEHRTLWLDLKILAGTLVKEFVKGTGY